jgi:hypothetical protein
MPSLRVPRLPYTPTTISRVHPTRLLLPGQQPRQVAFQVGHFTTDGGPTVEIEVVDHGTVTLPASMVNADKTVPTGYNVKLYINQLPEGEPPAGQSWAKKTNGSHQVFVNKPAGVGPGELMDALRANGAVKVV